LFFDIGDSKRLVIQSGLMNSGVEDDDPAAAEFCLELCSEIRSQLARDVFHIQPLACEKETFSTRSTVFFQLGVIQ
jgi:hypothetical protein